MVARRPANSKALRLGTVLRKHFSWFSFTVKLPLIPTTKTIQLDVCSSLGREILKGELEKARVPRRFPRKTPNV